MAVSRINDSRRTSLGAANLLFERIPDKLFYPLATTNRNRYWSVLCELHTRVFGPDAPLPPSRGFTVKAIIDQIKDILLMMDIWENEEGHSAEIPFETRANTVFHYLLECGWFQRETLGFEKLISMRPAVSQFLTLLVSFAETGPMFVSGKIRSIDLNLQQIIAGHADGDTLGEAAKQTRELLDHVRNTSTNIRDIMDALGEETSTAQYVQRFFNDYIENVFIGDYRELRTREHPLSRRPQILRIVDELSINDAHRERLITWYETKRCGGDRQKAQQFFNKDIIRLQELRRIDEFLDRLDDEIRRANRRALAYLDYRLRSLRPIDNIIKHAISSALADRLPSMGDPFPVDGMVSAMCLVGPRVKRERQAPSSLRRQVPSKEQLAKSRLMLKARDARSVTPPKLAEYVLRLLQNQNSISNEDLSMESIQDIRHLQTLSALGMAMSSNSRRLNLWALTNAKGFRVRLTGDEEIPGDALSGRPFRVERRQSQKKRPEGENR